METTNNERPTGELICQVLQLDSEEDGYWDILTVLWRRDTADTLFRARQLCASPIESRTAVYSSLSDAIETCGCKEQ